MTKDSWVGYAKNSDSQRVLFKEKNSNLVLKLNQIKAFPQIEHTDSK